MIKYKVGDLIEAFKSGEVNVIMHCCNCFNTMGSGIAKAIKDNFFEAYQSDCTTEMGSVLKLGSYTRGIVPEGAIYNLYGQYDFGGKCRNLEYGSLLAALDSVFDELDWETDLVPLAPLPVVGVPLLGAGLAGGEWRYIETILNYVSSKYRIDITVYVLDESLIPDGRERVK